MEEEKICGTCKHDDGLIVVQDGNEPCWTCLHSDEYLPKWEAEEAECEFCKNHDLEYGDTLYLQTSWDGGIGYEYVEPVRYCPICGRDLKQEG